MHKSDNSRGALKLKDAEALTPAVNPVEAMRKQLALTLFDSVKPQDVLDVANKLKEMALAGDHKAMQMFFKLMLPADGKPTAPPADSGGLRMMAEALQNLVDEIRIGKAKVARRGELPAPDSEDDE